MSDCKYTRSYDHSINKNYRVERLSDENYNEPVFYVHPENPQARLINRLWPSFVMVVLLFIPQTGICAWLSIREQTSVGKDLQDPQIG